MAQKEPVRSLAGRFVLLRLKRSFFGYEDLGLADRLLRELPGILLWALDGLNRLHARRYFTQPASAIEMMKQLEVLASPIKSFVAERCVIEPGASISCKAMFALWCEFADQQGREHWGTEQIFGRNLLAAFPHIRVTRPRIDGVRERRYEGIRARSAMDPEPEGV